MSTPSTASPSSCATHSPHDTAETPETPVGWERSTHGTRSLQELRAQGPPVLQALLSACRPFNISYTGVHSAARAMSVSAAASASLAALPPPPPHRAVTRRTSHSKEQACNRELLAQYVQQQDALKRAAQEAHEQVRAILANPAESWGEAAMWQLAVCQRGGSLRACNSSCSRISFNMECGRTGSWRALRHTWAALAWA